jgi:NAD(P)-dependent dehydrogenase (short-subunit alcohol dehydrogenase family)
MTVALKPLRDQVIVITGASSGIGLTTARMAAAAGARVVLAARNHEALSRLEREINASGGESCHVDADVGSEADVRRVAEQAVARFGGFDTWVNNAGVTVYGRLEEVTAEDHRRLFDTNFWGVVHGSLAAVRHFKTRADGSGTGGALINVGSTLSDRSIPLQGMYCASKHAVKGFTDALRMEVEEAGYPIAVTLVKPAAVDTPYTEHAKNYMPVEPQNPAPVYAPETVARAILHAATHAERDIFVGASGKLFSVMEKLAPRLTDLYMEKMLFRQQQTDRPAHGNGHGGLHSAGRGLSERGGYAGHVAETSVYTQASLHPWLTTAIVGAAGIAVAALLGAAGSAHPRRRARRR